MGRSARQCGPDVPTQIVRSDRDAVGAGKLGEVCGGQLVSQGGVRRLERHVHLTGPVGPALPATDHAAREVPVIFNGIDHPQKINLRGGYGQSITARTTGGPDRDSCPDEVCQDVGEESGWDAHPFRDPARAHRMTVVERDERKRGTNGVIAPTGQRDAHDRILRPSAAL